MRKICTSGIFFGLWVAKSGLRFSFVFQAFLTKQYFLRNKTDLVTYIQHIVTHILVLEVLLNHEEGKWFIMYPPLWNVIICNIYCLNYTNF